MFTVVSAQAAEVATYTFHGNLAAQQAGVVALTAVDPQGAAGFGTDTVFGNTRSVYMFSGNTTPSQQGGLQLDTSGLISNANGYSAEILFKFNSGNNAWRRILDSLDRGSDAGLYIDTNNNVDIYTAAAVSTGFQTGRYYDIALTVSPANVDNVYVDGNLALTTTTAAMNLSSNFLNFFLDNNTGGGIGEYAPGSVALIRVFDAPLSASEVTTLARDPFAGTAAPEPSTWLLLAPGFAGLALVRRKLVRSTQV